MAASASAAAPVAYDDLVATKADTQVTLDYLLLNDKDADGNTLSVTAVTTPAHGTLTLISGNSYRYTPTAGYKGRDSFTYTVSDGTGGTDTAVVNLSVNAAFDAMVARDTILAGVAQIADPTQPSVMSVWGPTAASISNYSGDDETNPMIAAATMGAGRVVAMPDHQWLNMNSYAGQFNTGVFYQNAIAWLASSASKSISILTMSSEVSTYLTAQGFTNVTSTTATGLAAALPGKAVFIPGWMGSAPSAANMTAIKDYVQAGGGLFACETSSGYAWWWNKKAWEIPLGLILREAGISFYGDGWEDPAFTMNRAANVVTMDTIVGVFQTPASYTTAQKIRAATVAKQMIASLPADDIDRVRCESLFKTKFASIIPTPQAPVTDAFERLVLDVECSMINALPPAQMTAHASALPVSAAAPRVTNATFGLTSPPSGHYTKTIYTPYYAAPGELVTIQFPAALTGLNLDVRVSHLRSSNDATSYPVMPVQMINFDVTTAQVQVANPHGGLIQIIVPDNVTWSGTQNIAITGAVEAPYFKLGTTTDAQWVAGIRDRGTPFGVLDSTEATLVIDADKWLRTLADPTPVMTEWNYFCGKLREFYAYNPGRQLPVHHDYYPAGGVSTYPQSYGLTDEITSSLRLQASAYALTLHEYGHICDSGNIQFDAFGETSPNLGGKWIQGTERNYAWKQALTVARINNYLYAQGDSALWTNGGHHAVHVKVVPFDLLAAEFGPALIKDTVAAMTALPSISTSQGKIDEWCRQLSNRTGLNLCDFFASWKLIVSASLRTELANKPNWMPVERVPEALTVAQGTPVNFVNPSQNDFSYDGGLTLTNVSQPTSGAIVNNGNGTYTYTPAVGFTGTASFTYSVSNTTGNTFTTTVPIHVVAAANDPKLASFDALANGSGWTTIQLEKSYNSMVVVAQPLVGPGSPPLTARIRNASGSSFEVKLDRLDGSATPVGPTTIRILTVEEGVYNEATHGIKMEAVKFNSAVTDRKGSFTGTSRSYAYTGYSHYSIPAVFGQVMTSNDARWSAFWFNADVNSVQLGKHVGEDSVTTRLDETIGYIVMESGSYQFGQYQLQVGNSNFDNYAGFATINEGGAGNTFQRFPVLHSAMVSGNIDVPWGESDPGLDGFVTMQKMAAGNALSAYLAEDSIGDAETATGNKAVSYLLTHRCDGAAVVKGDQYVAITNKETLMKVLGNDDVASAPALQVTQPANGTVTAHTDGNLIYTSNAGFTGSDVFTYTATTAAGSSSAVVSVQVVSSGPSQAGITADRFNSISGGSVSNLTSSPNYPNSPSTRTVWTSVNSGQNVGDNLGHRVYGYVVPPTTGDYTFWIASDDNSQLLLSSDINPANAVMIANVSGYTGYQAWDANSSQKSVTIPLIGGRAYYVEVLHKEGGGGDHVSVAWQGPGIARALLATPNILTVGNTAPTLVSTPSNVNMDEGSAPVQINVGGVFAGTDSGDPLTVEVHSNTQPDVVSASIAGNTLTVAQAGTATGSSVITLRATDRTGTLVTTSFSVVIYDLDSDDDNDGLTLAGERALGTNPNVADSDGDGFGDGFEVAMGTTPTNSVSKPDVLYTGLQAWWPLDETSGTVANDITGRPQDGTLLNAPTWTTGLNGGGVTLNGTNQSIRVQTLSLNSNTVTLSAWVKRNGAQVSWAGVVFDRGNSASGLNFGTANELRYHWNDAGNTYGFNSGLTVPDNSWTFCALVIEPGKATFYMQPAGGVMQSAVNTVTHAAHNFSANTYLGQDSTGGRFFKGSLDEVQVFARSLSAAEIGSLYESANPPHAPVFTSNPVTKPAATAGSAYTGSTLAGSATDQDAGDTLGYSKVSGPAWLTIAPNGALSGTPAAADVGSNTWTVRVADSQGNSSDASLNILVNQSALPAGWTGADIGSVGVAGSASESSGTYTVSGSGADIWNSADAFQFVSQTLAGDGEIRARVTSQSNTNAFAKAGVMIRDGSGVGAVNALMAITPGNGFHFQSRATASGTSSSTAGPVLNATPNNWVRITRSGGVVTAYASANGTTWVQVGTVNLTMTNSISVGLAVTSHNNASLSTATFDNVSVTSFPAPWITSDIGTTGLMGSAEYFGSAYTVKGAGAFGGTADSLRYVYQTLSADGSITARINTLQNTGTSARVGVMIRDTLVNNSRMAALSVNGSGAWRWDRRTTAGGSVSTTNSSSGTAPNLWVRLTRSGNTITAYRSTNGTTWTNIGSATVTMASNCYIGIGVASGTTTTLNAAGLDNVTVVP